MKRILIISFYVLTVTSFLYAQQNMKLKFIPEISVKFGSQQPIIGFQTCFSGGVLFNDSWFAGIGGGYTSDLGLGGKTFPLYLDGRFCFSGTGILNFLGFERSRALPMMLYLKQGISINSNDPFRTGYLFTGGTAVKWDVIKFNEKSILPFWSGIELEFNRTAFYDEYRGYAITDGYISQIFLLFTFSIDIQAIQL